MYPTAPDLVGFTEVRILPLANHELDADGFDPRSQYAESFWLPVLGPSTLWLLRHIASRFDIEPNGFSLDLSDTASAIGIRSNGGRNSAFHRSLNRIVGFNMGRTVDDQTIAVRQVLPPLRHGQIKRLPEQLQASHRDLLETREMHRSEDLLRSTKVATTLLRLGDSPDLVEQQLVSWGIDPRTANEAVNHAWASKAREDQHAAAS